jgi:hypothetical protein
MICEKIFGVKVVVICVRLRFRSVVDGGVFDIIVQTDVRCVLEYCGDIGLPG